MFKIIETQKTTVRACEDCKYCHFNCYGNGDSGGYMYYCGKMHNKYIIHCKYFTKEKASEAFYLSEKEIKKIAIWCPLNKKGGKT
jgi:hypothetical protein